MSADTPRASERPTEEITLTVNGEEVTAEVEPRLKLSDFLRTERGCRGVRVGCEHGVCGACTVLMDGRGAKSCLSFAVQADGTEITTVEGLTGEGKGGLHPIQEAFHEEHALQCGFCTSGFVMATKELLDEDPDPDREAIERGLADNVCRCTGYRNIYAAVERAADYLDDAGAGTDDAAAGEEGAAAGEEGAAAGEDGTGSDVGATGTGGED